MSREYRTLDVPVKGGALRVGVWETDAPDAPTALLIHGVTSSHRAWPWLAECLPDVRLIAPDLRGRGRSNGVTGAGGLAAHADDMAAVLDAAGVQRTLVVGHSMGAFVALAFAHRHPQRVASLLLVDGGLPLDVPEGLDADTVVSHILGPTAERLNQRFADHAAYLAFWRDHPAFQGAWSDQLEEYFVYDLSPDGDLLRPATSYRTTVDDTVDMNTGATLPAALDALSHDTVLLTVPRGLRDELPGLYPPAHLQPLLERMPHVRHHLIEGMNHYTIVLSGHGAAAVAGHVRKALAPTR
ncbi:alpha/beta hydrolase [Microbacterium sp. zg-Y818]|uniref:alpha/beta fold hydrolase n=1 Tax=unclassified Microbacterium TaxID=2609290 RepID=UPI00214CF240|nr:MULTISPECIES: alpha/beta hydrolase [unclassified Microbacterium]MCR2801156.1 alpha/beta hydrolase [Microbacterium sp. zg.Y818]WIM20992.1 alpha/beta hydrolase [Microbacterium sp. zg-Y818]